MCRSRSCVKPKLACRKISNFFLTSARCVSSRGPCARFGVLEPIIHMAQTPSRCRAEHRARFRRLSLGLHELLGARARYPRVRRLAPARSGPAALFDELPLPPRVYLQELRVLCGRVRLLHEARDAGRGERDHHGRVGTFDRDPLGGAAEDPSHPRKADDHGCDRAADDTPNRWFEPRCLQLHYQRPPRADPPKPREVPPPPPRVPPDEAFSTRSWRPSRSLPLNCAIAWSASSVVAISTKPK